MMWLRGVTFRKVRKDGNHTNQARRVKSSSVRVSSQVTRKREVSQERMVRVLACSLLLLTTVTHKAALKSFIFVIGG